jgi:uncharacterized protein (DUF885 family)
MQKKLLLFLILSIIFSGCKQKSTNTQAASAETDYQQLSENFLSGYLNWRPQNAVSLGFHDYDGKLPDFSKESLGQELARLKEYDQKFVAIDTSTLSEKMLFDLRLLKNEVKQDIFNMDDLHAFNSNPMVYAGAIDVNTYIKRNFAPLEDRLRSIISIENLAPLLYDQAKANLDDSLAKPFIEMAILIAKGSASFLGNDLLVALKDVKNDTLMKAFKVSNKKAMDAINGFAGYLQKEKLPKAHNHYAIGRENYQKMLLYSEDISMSPEKILEIGLSELKKEQES